MSDAQSPGQISNILHPSGSVSPVQEGAPLQSNPLLKTKKAVDHTTLTHVHITPESVATFECTPPHALRVQTAMFERSRKYLIDTQDKPCAVCGIRTSTLKDVKANRFGAAVLEAHHYPIERSLLDACDPNKVHLSFPEVIDKETLEAFVDSPRNLIVLCNIHHVSLEQGIHHLVVQDYAILPYLLDDYQIVATARDKDVVQAKDEIIEQRHQRS